MQPLARIALPPPPTPLGRMLKCGICRLRKRARVGGGRALDAWAHTSIPSPWLSGANRPERGRALVFEGFRSLCLDFAAGLHISSSSLIQIFIYRFIYFHVSSFFKRVWTACARGPACGRPKHLLRLRHPPKLIASGSRQWIKRLPGKAVVAICESIRAKLFGPVGIASSGSDVLLVDWSGKAAAASHPSGSRMVHSGGV